MAKTVTLVIEVQYTVENASHEPVNTNRLLQRVPQILEDTVQGAPTGVQTGSTKVLIRDKKIS